MLNVERKKELIKENIYSDYTKKRYKKIQDCKDKNINVPILDYEYFKDEYSSEDYKILEQIRDARKHQRKKIKEHISYYLNQSFRDDISAYFMTFTYSNTKGYKKQISAYTLKKYVIKALSDFDDYIINIDYGEEKERMHFHAVAFINKNKNFTEKQFKWKDKKNNLHFCTGIVNDDLKEYEKKVGFYCAEYIKNESELDADKNKDLDKIRLSRYLDKLTLHSIKVKQNYVSVKKNTLYSKHKKLLSTYMKLKKDFGQRYPLAEIKDELSRLPEIYLNNYFVDNSTGEIIEDNFESACYRINALSKLAANYTDRL